MIKTQTIFVLGAGANVPYGFSTGGGLLDRARSSQVNAILENAAQQVTGPQRLQFAHAIRDNMLSSIDALLEHRRDLWPVGKRVMARLLYQEEERAAPISNAEDWMSLVFERMSEGASTLQEFADNNKVVFITFNYDRYLEQRMIRGLAARYRVSPHEAWVALKNMKFLHLYGSLGILPDQADPTAQQNVQVIPLGAPETPEVFTLGLALQSVEQSIQIVHDDVRPEIFREASECFEDASQIFFLGFGFGRKNVERLCTRDIPVSVFIACTTYGMTNAEEQEYVYSSFPQHARDGHYEFSQSPIRLFLRERIKMLS